MGTNWMPTFPEVTGDSRRMNSNHGVAAIIDAYRKGVTHFDLAKAYDACRKAIEEKTLIPWSGKPAGWLDDFYKEHGYIPALRPDEKETVANVSIWEKRQPVAVTLGTAYDQWCLSQIALELGKEEEANHYLKCSYNYRNLFNPETHFFHPKDKEGKFIYPLDYRYDGGLGARDYYDENNGYVYRWDVSITLAIWSNWWEATRHFPLRLTRCSTRRSACPNGNSIPSCQTIQATWACSPWRMSPVCMFLIYITMLANLGSHKSVYANY